MVFDIRRDRCWWPSSARLPSLVDKRSIVNQEGWERAYSVHKDRTSSVEKYEAEIRKQKNKQFSNGLSEFF